MNTEELNKSIDALIDDVFSDEAPENVEKASPIDIAHDASETADEAVNQAPKGQKDEARGAGRPAQISDVPQVDMDGRRESEYDASTTENENKEDEPDETDQSPAIDQSSEGKGRLPKSGKAPAVRPFKKSEGFNEDEWNEYQALKKAKEDAEAEELRKAEEKAEQEKLEKARKEQESLIKSAVTEALAPLQKENEELKKSLRDQGELVKAIASQPQRPKSITGIEQLEKSQDPDLKEGPESFSKAEVKDAAFELAKSGKISEDAAYEIDMTGTTSDMEARARVEKYLETGK